MFWRNTREADQHIKKAIAIMLVLAHSEVKGLIEALTAQLRWGKLKYRPPIPMPELV